MKKRAAAALAAVAIGWSAAALADTPCLDVQDGQGRKLPGVSATLANWTRYTDASGRVCFQNVPPGRYQVMLRAGPVTGSCNVVSNQASTSCALAAR
jgi:hypothetical protein